MQHEKVLYPENERFTRQQLEENERIYFVNKGVYGTEDGLDSDALSRIDRIKKIFHFVEPELDK